MSQRSSENGTVRIAVTACSAAALAMIVFATASIAVAQPQTPDTPQATKTTKPKPAKVKRAKPKRAPVQNEELAGTKKEQAAAEKAAAETRGGDATVPRPLGPVNLPTQIDPGTGEKVLVISNDSLESIYGPPSPDATSSAYVSYGDFGTAVEPEESAEPDASAERAKRLGEIDDALARLNGNLLRIRNPLLRRPDLTEEEAQAQAGMDNVERLRATEARIAELEAERAELNTGRVSGARASTSRGR